MRNRSICPGSLVAFCPHYTKDAWLCIVVAALLASLIALAEVWMLGFLGNIVMVVLLRMVVLPSLVNQQTLMGNYPMRIRGQVHWYLLKYSMSF